MFANSRFERNDSRREADKAEESLGELGLPCGDAAEVPDPLEEILDQVALAISRLAVASLLVAVGARREAGFDAALAEPLAEGVAIATLGKRPLWPLLTLLRTDSDPEVIHVVSRRDTRFMPPRVHRRASAPWPRLRA